MCLGKENNKMSKTVTGCIVTYNNIATIDNAVSSLLEYTQAPFRLYVVDNGSTDGTIELIEKKYPQALLESMPSMWFIRNKEKIEYDVISSDVTESVLNTRRENDIELFS